MTIQERMELLGSIHPEINGSYTHGLDIKTADLMIENCVGKIAIPVGLGLNFMVNKKEYIVPMSTEEPSVIAAASAAAKLIKKCGGFKAYSTDPIMIGQIQVLDIDSKVFHGLVLEHEKELTAKANTKYCPRMVKRGGGVLSLQFTEMNPRAGVVEINVNVGEAMGANIVNGICEGLASDLQLLSECRIGLRILSNYCPDRKAVSEFRIPLKDLTYKSIPGSDIAKRFIESYEFAKFSVNRACTHNKGILNGVVAVCLATGQDTRAVESAAHSWASHSGRYQPLNSYKIEAGHLIGRIELPIAIGTAGGALKTNPGYQGSMSLLGNPSSTELAQLVASVGLASNFAAIRAMVSEGISKGHMALHAKNIALSAGVPNSIVSEVVEYMKQRGDISQKSALDYLAAHHIHTISRKSFKQHGALNTFHISLQDPPLSFTLAFTCPKISSVHVDLSSSQRCSMNGDLNKLFVRKDYKWLDSFIRIIEKIRFQPLNPRNNQSLVIKLKLFAIWLNEISIHLVSLMGASFCQSVFNEVFAMRRDSLEKLTEGVANYVEFGIYLAYELYHVLNFNLENFDNSPVENSAELASRIRKEIKLVVSYNLKTNNNNNTTKDYKALVEIRQKQMCATLMLYCDCLGEDTVGVQLLQNLEKLGQTLELMSSARRDYEKYLKGENQAPNLYAAWQEMGVERGSYFRYFDDLVKERAKGLPSDLARLAAKAEALMDGYYSKYPKNADETSFPKL